MNCPHNNQAASPLFVLIGCTATGKTQVAFHLAAILHAEILSLDSMMVYRRMDVGTAKPPAYQRQVIPHHLIDVVQPSEAFSVARYLDLADAAIAQIHSRGRAVLAVGGTALYLKALTEGLFEGPPADPDFRRTLRQRAAQHGISALHAELARVDPHAAAHVHPNDLRRIERALEIFHTTGQPISSLQRQWGSDKRYRCLVIGLRRSRQDLHHRINRRVTQMIASGLVHEVRGLLCEPKALSPQARQALGYAQIIDHLHGQSDLAQAVEKIKILTRRFAKSQRTWFRRFPDVTWLDIQPDEPPDAVARRAAALLHAARSSLPPAT
jgi:tRNA dimethylallyltransferase